MATTARTPIDALRDLATTAERFLQLTRTDCDALPSGHETTCQCDAHRQVRLAADELELVIRTVRGS